MTSGTIISGDSHVIEPSELWTKPLGAKYGDAVPHIIKEFNGEKAEHFFTGIEYIRIDKSCIINCDARREWAPYQDKIYDPFWACAQELDQPVTLHIITGNEVDLFTLHGKDRVNVPRSTIGVFAEAGPVLANEFIFGGVLDRFPKLKLVCSEYEVSWLPYWLFRTKQIQDDFGPAMNIPEIKKPIEEYMSQIYHGLIDDPYLDKVLDVIDPKTIMWGSDFPHARCTYPNTRDVIKRVFGHLDAELRDDIVYRNCARFYNMELPD